MRKATEKEIKDFITYISLHIALVERIGQLVFGENYSDHDYDKCTPNEEDLNLFALRNSMINGDYHPNNEDRRKLNNLVKNHVLNQKHHPEYWSTEYDEILKSDWNEENPPHVHAQHMPDKWVKHMLSDWSAVALKKNQPIFKWYNKTCCGDNPRFIFTDKQKELIINSLNLIQKAIKKEHLSYPGITYNAKQVEPLKENKDVISKSWVERMKEVSTPLNEKLIKSDLEKLKKEMGEDESLNKFLTTSLENLPDNYRYFLTDKEFEKFKGASLFDFMEFVDRFFDDFETFYSEDNKLLGWFSYKSSGDTIGNIKMFSFNREDNNNLVFMKDVLSKFQELLSKYSVISWSAHEKNPFIKHYFKAIEKFNGTYKTNEDSVIFTIKKDNLKESKKDNFKKWFGNSKVVDKDGNPLVVYHGSMTDEKIDCFNPEKYNGSVGTYFTDNYQAALSYTPNENEDKVYACYLKMENPLVIDCNDDGDCYTWGDIPFEGKRITTDTLLEIAHQRGYDGVILKDIVEGCYEYPITDYVIFNSCQAKSATDNNGNFSIESDNIYEKILKKGNKWQVTDHTGKKNLGTYDTKEEAEKRLKQVEYFKNQESNMIKSNRITEADRSRFIKSNPNLTSGQQLDKPMEIAGMSSADHNQIGKFADLIYHHGLDHHELPGHTCWSRLENKEVSKNMANLKEYNKKELINDINQIENQAVKNYKQDYDPNRKASFEGRVVACEEIKELASNLPNEVTMPEDLLESNTKVIYVVTDNEGNPVRSMNTGIVFKTEDIDEAKDLRKYLSDKFKCAFRITKIAHQTESKLTEDGEGGGAAGASSSGAVSGGSANFSSGFSALAPEKPVKTVKLGGGTGLIDPSGQLLESKEKSAAFTFGRMCLPQYGYIKLWEKIASLSTEDHLIYASHSYNKNNPITYETKSSVIKYLLKEYNIDAQFVDTEAKTIIEVALDLYNKGYKNIVFVGGSDRVDDVMNLLKKYNDVPDKEGRYYHFDSITGVSGGDRDPDSDSVEGMSGTKMRQFIKDDDFENFKKNCPIKDIHILKDIYDEAKQILG